MNIGAIIKVGDKNLQKLMLRNANELANASTYRKLIEGEDYGNCLQNNQTFEDDQVLQKLGELSYLEHLISRLRSIDNLQIILVTTALHLQETLREIAAKEDLSLIVDNELDHHNILLLAAKQLNLDIIVDVPVQFVSLAVHHTSDMIKHHLDSKADLTVPLNFPFGSVPLSVISVSTLEKIAATDNGEPYYFDFDKLSCDIEVNEFLLEGRRTYFETMLTLTSKRGKECVDKMLNESLDSKEAEVKFFEELNIEDKYNLFFSIAPAYSIEPTNHCNLRCVDCLHGKNLLTREKGIMKLDDFKKITRHLPDNSTFYLFGAGESFINKHIYQMINTCSDNQYTCISTNGHFFHSLKNKQKLVDSNLNLLVLAIDGASEETYSKYRSRGMFSRITKDIKELMELRNSNGSKRPIVMLQFILFDFNEHEKDKAKKMAEDLGVDQVFFKTTLSTFKGSSGNRNRKDRRLQVAVGKRPVNPFAVCLSPTVFWNGDYSPCCYFYNNDRILGNLVKQSFEELQSSSVFQEFASRRASLEEEVCARRNCYCFS